MVLALGHTISGRTVTYNIVADPGKVWGVFVYSKQIYSDPRNWGGDYPFFVEEFSGIGPKTKVSTYAKYGDYIAKLQDPVTGVYVDYVMFTLKESSPIPPPPPPPPPPPSPPPVPGDSGIDISLLIILGLLIVFYFMEKRK